MPTLAFIAGLVGVGFVGILGLFILWSILIGKIDLQYLISEEDGSASMSRFQFLVFTFVVAIALMVLTLESGEFPELGADVMGLLGISGGSYVVSKGIQKNFEKPPGGGSSAPPGSNPSART